MATRRGEENTGHGKRPTRTNAYVFLVISVLAVALAATILAAASGVFGDLVQDPTAENLPGGIEAAKEVPRGQQQ
jgi:hypothetical protein